jgi:hypothetical protein
MKRLVSISALAVVMWSMAPLAARADAVVDWNRIMLTTVGGQNPFAQARLAAITQLAVFEAVNACVRRYEPYLGTVVAPFGASPEAAAIVAAHDVLVFYVPASAAALDAQRDQSLALIPEGQAKWNGISVGADAARALIELRANDGATPPETFLPNSNEPGVWQPTPPGFGPGVLLHWRNLTPFGIDSADRFRSSPPPSLTSWRYARDHREVMARGSLDSADRPQSRTDVARFFAAASAAHAWNMALQQVSVARKRSLPQNARTFALLNMAISDGLVASMETKYHYTFWRPVTAIRGGDVEGNPLTDVDAGWTPLITTPSFPSYPSAHASASYAARRIAETFFGRHQTFTITHPAVPDVVLEYRTFADLTHDIDDARVYGGIHFRFDQEAGAVQGEQVGRHIVRHHLRRAHSDSGGDR